MDGIGKNAGKYLTESKAKILVEEQVHA